MPVNQSERLPGPSSMTGHRRGLGFTSWHLTGLLVAMLAFSVACAGAPKQGLVPVSTVAVAGADGQEFDMHEDPAEEASPPEFNQNRFDVVSLSEMDHVRIEAPGSDKVVLKITSVTIGEALAFLSGGHMPGVDAISETIIVEDGDILDLSHLMEHGAGLVTVDAEALEDDDVVGGLRKLVQLTPLAITAEQKGNAVHISLVDDEDEPVVNAEVELLDADSRSIDQTVTGPSGRAALSTQKKRPRAILGDGLFVTARIGQFRALLKL